MCGTTGDRHVLQVLSKLCNVLVDMVVPFAQLVDGVCRVSER